MKLPIRISPLIIGFTACSTLILGACVTHSPQPKNPMTFFLTSANPGKGADLGGLAGADRHCQTLAETVGADGKNWKAYLSTSATGSTAAIDARDRIGKGPWQNARGVVIANNLDELHGANNLNKQTALTEKGEIVSGRGDPVNQHDVLTGSTDNGRLAIAATAGGDTTCGNWTKSAEGSAFVGHHDRIGANDSAPMKSWNSSHPSRGCGMDALKATGGAGLFYCFAAN
ncbi:MAG: hypothetical protein ACRCV9_12165 [Burkholderiaceae bacterium]